MDAMTQMLMGQLADTGVSAISKKLGIDENTAKTALSVAVPLLVSALAKNASKPAGAQALHTALAEDHDGSIFDNLSGFLSNPQSANGAGILKHVLGGQQPTVTQGLAQGTGLNAGQVGQLLQIAAPLVMGAIGQQQQKKNMDPQGLSSFLGKETQKAHSDTPDIMGALNKMLDTDQDGSGLDDAASMLGKLFGG